MMKKIAMIVCCLLLAGCRGNKKNEEVIVDEGKFPDFLVGEWVGRAELGENQEWKITFIPNGEISTVTMPMGKVVMKPGHVTQFPTWNGGKGIYEPGKWVVGWSAKTRQLAITLELKHFYQDLGPNAIEGSLVDILAGEVSPDGKTWTADWMGFPKYTVKSTQYGIKELATDPNGELRGKVFFKKVDNIKVLGN